MVAIASWPNSPAFSARRALLTLTGVGGVGKTRLAVHLGAEVLAEHPDGVWLVDLAPVSDPSLVAHTALSALGISGESPQPVMQRMVDYLRDKALLLILDNCEHLIDASAHLADDLLAVCPRLKILGTSREALRVSGEVAWRVPSLPFPEQAEVDPQATGHYDAVRLFIERARGVRSDFAVTEASAPFVAQICRRLDGIPLAIELAAARARVMPVEEIARRLDDRFRLLTGGSRTALRRQQPLAALIDWSHDLLDERQRVLFNRLSVFAGGTTLEAAEAVCAGEAIQASQILDLLTALVDRSLVVCDQSGDAARYRMLETIREYALEKLFASGEAGVVRQRHADHFLAFAIHDAPGGRHATYRAWRCAVDPEIDNLRTALAWLASQEGRKEQELRMALGLADYWTATGSRAEGERAIDDGLSCQRDVPADVVAMALVRAATYAARRQDFARGYQRFHEAEEVYLAEGDDKGILVCMRGIAELDFAQGRDAEATDRLARALDLARRMGDQQRVAALLGDLAYYHEAVGEPRLADPYLGEQERVHRELGWPWPPLHYNWIGWRAWRQGDYATAERIFREYLDQALASGDPTSIAAASYSMGCVLRTLGRYDEAAEAQEQLLAECRRQRVPPAEALSELGFVHWLGGRGSAATEALRECLTVLQGYSAVHSASLCLLRVACLVHAQGQHAAAARLSGAAVALGEVYWRARPPVENRIYADTMDCAREALGDERYEEEYAEGAAMSAEEALAYALAVIGNGPAP